MNETGGYEKKSERGGIGVSLLNLSGHVDFANKWLLSKGVVLDGNFFSALGARLLTLICLS